MPPNRVVGGTVILIDEYDKPMLQAIGNEELQDSYRDTLKAFYSVLKTMDKYIQFAFLTGVTKFGKVSVFSDLNNLKDISMDKRYTELCGITNEEYIYVMEFKFDGSAEEALQQIEEKRYILPFAKDNRKIVKVGVNFSSKTRDIEKWLVKEVE